MNKFNPAKRKPGNDCIATPGWVADDMIDFFRPKGRVLDPCMGDGVFFDRIEGCEWCEILRDRDFFDETPYFDCVIGNPPYSAIRKFALHGMSISDRVILLIPVWKAFNALGLMKAAEIYGGISHIRTYGGGGRLGFPMGNAIGAVEWSKGHKRGTTYSFYKGVL